MLYVFTASPALMVIVNMAAIILMTFLFIPVCNTYIQIHAKKDGQCPSLFSASIINF